MASCCCWPPDRSPPRRCRIVFSTGKRSKIRGGTLRAPFRRTPRPTSQILFDGELRKDLAALRHVADAETRARFGRLRAKIAAVEPDFTRRRRQQSHDAFEQRGLAHSVAAHQAGAGSRRHVEVDVPQRVAAAVKLVERGDAEQAHVPRYTSMTRGSFCTRSMLPSASTRPSWRTTTRLAIDRTKSMSCSTTTTE